MIQGVCRLSHVRWHGDVVQIAGLFRTREAPEMHQLCDFSCRLGTGMYHNVSDKVFIELFCGAHVNYVLCACSA